MEFCTITISHSSASYGILGKMFKWLSISCDTVTYPPQSVAASARPRYYFLFIDNEVCLLHLHSICIHSGDIWNVQELRVSTPTESGWGISGDDRLLCPWHSSFRASGVSRTLTSAGRHLRGRFPVGGTQTCILLQTSEARVFFSLREMTSFW